MMKIYLCYVLLQISNLLSKTNQDGRRISPMKYFAYLLNVRDRGADYLFQMGRLFQEFCIFGRLAIDNSRLMYQLTHQKELRAEKYCSLRRV